MIGSHEIIVQNRRVQYKFTINRNITILQGDSATGKTTLIEMIEAYQTNGVNSGVTIKCDVKCVALPISNWQLILEATHNSIVFIDEGDAFIASIAFATAVKNSDNYFVIATRRALSALPYSVTEIYGIKNKAGNRYQGTKRIYSGFYPLHPQNDTNPKRPDVVVVEDSNSGYAFFKNVCAEFKIPCISAKGKSNIYKTVVALPPDQNILIIADGAAFGSEINRLTALMKQRQNITICLPESFEWLILESGIIVSTHIREILAHPSDYIESSEYFSWERFFTHLLIMETQDSYLRYNKQHLNDVYLHDGNKEKILSGIIQSDKACHILKAHNKK